MEGEAKRSSGEPRARGFADVSRTGISPTRAEDFPQWFQSVVRDAEVAELDHVRGCMVIRPWGYGIWELMQRAMDNAIKATGASNAYFPLFIPLSCEDEPPAPPADMSASLDQGAFIPCDVSKGQMTNPDCPSNMPICHPMGGVCVGCIPSFQTCLAGYECNEQNQCACYSVLRRSCSLSSL